MSKKQTSGLLQSFFILLLLLYLVQVDCFAQGPEEFETVNQKKEAKTTIASPPGFSQLSLIVLYQPRYSVEKPALFDISKQGVNSSNQGSPAEGKTVPNGKPVAASTGQYQPLPVTTGNAPYSGNPYHQAPAGNVQQRYADIPLRPRSNVKLPGSNVPIPAPLKLNDKKSNYDIAPSRVNKRNVPFAGSKVPVPKPLNTGYGQLPANLVNNPSFAASNTSVTKSLSVSGNLPNNTSRAATASTTTPANGGYQFLPVNRNVTLPGSKVAIPRPLVVPGSQRSEGSFKTASTSATASGTVSNTGMATSFNASQKYVAAPAPPGQSAKTRVIHQYDKVPEIFTGDQSSARPLSPTNGSAYQKLTLKKDGYESSTQSLSGTKTATYQKLTLKNGSYESATRPLSSARSTTYQKLTLRKVGYESSTQLLSSSSGPGNKTLPVKSNGYESATQPLSPPGATVNQTSPLANRGYDKINQAPPGYSNAPAPVKKYQSVTSPLSAGASIKSTAAQTTVINGYTAKVPVPSRVKPLSRPNTGVYVPAPKTNTTVATASSKGATEVKRGALTQGSVTKGALQVSKATQDKVNADKTKEAAKQKAVKQRRTAASSGKKG